MIAAPAPVWQALGSALRELVVEVYGCTTAAEAEKYLGRRFDLILVCYVFDDLRPYHFIDRIRHEGENTRTPIVLVRALPVPLGKSQEWEIATAYKSIGVDEFCNYSELVHEQGAEQADQALRKCATGLLQTSDRRQSRA
jgi:CheY-like chemotaxis protein